MTQADTQFSTRTVPWMKLGQLIDKPVTAAEAAKLGGLNFAVREEPVYRMTKADGKPPRYTKIETRKALVNAETDQTLSIVSVGYPVVQFAEGFDFMDAFGSPYVAAGALRGGKQGFMVVDASHINVSPSEDDPHELYAVLRTSHDCSRAVEVNVMPLRGRCMNQLTLNSFRKDVPYRWTVTHTGDVKSKLAALAVTVANLESYAKSYVANAQRLMAIKVDAENATTILRRALPVRPKTDEAIGKILINWTERKDSVGFDGTGWGLVQAVSEYYEWDRKGGTPESRFLAALQGQTRNAINKTTAALLSRG